jgi:organic radical activating enzyme
VKLRVLSNEAHGTDVLAERGPVPPWPHRALVEWQVVGQCNYDCSYCIQSRRHRKGAPSLDQLERALAFLATLSADGTAWEVKTTGGEPFSYKPFLDVVVPRLVQMGHLVSTLTNLSSPREQLVRFAKVTRGHLGVVSASLHLEHTDAQSFLERLRALRDHADARARIVVNAVLVPERLPDVLAAKHAVERAGFTFFPQLMKVKGGVFAYSPAQMALVDEIVGGLELAEEERSANLAPAYTGKLCYTGARYFVLDKDGTAWSCRTAKRFGEGRLGHIDDGIALRAGPIRCPYTICPCSTPANRGMIEGVRARLGSVHHEA